jgi:putative phage-type endonuclease
MSEQPIIQAMLERCLNAVKTDAMSYEDWLDLRRNSIGGSDAGALMLLNDFSSPYMIYWQKKGAEKSADMSAAAKRGKLLEPVMRGWFADAFPDLEIVKVPYMFYSPDHPFMSANVDGLINAKTLITIDGKELQGIGGLEIKSSKYGFDFSDSEVPDSYYAQVQHYMAVLGLKWFVLSVCFLDSEEIQNYSILRDDDFINKMIETEKTFWEGNVIPSIIPAALGLDAEDDMITGMYDGSAATLALNEHEKTLCRKIAGLREKIKALKEDKDAAKIDLKTSLTTRAKPSKTERKLSALGGEITVSWSFYETKSVDTKKLRDAGLYEQYSKTTEADRLTVTLKKGA